MSTLAQIEIVLFLRDVDLFRFCEADEVLRIAAIAREQRVAAAETIYAVDEPSDALYCVVEGEISLVAQDGAITRIGPRDTFGVSSILSGRLRVNSAVAKVDTLVLRLDAEDFFDLLSNNIEIVKALFRRLMQGSLAGMAR